MATTSRTTAALAAARGRRLGDRGVALLYLVVGLVLHGVGISSSGPAVAGAPAAWLHTGLLVAACTALVVKRRHPVLVLGVVVAAGLGGLAVGGSVGLVLAFVDALYTAALLVGPRGRRVLVAGVVAATVAVGALVPWLGGGVRETAAMLLQAVALLVTPLWWASDVRSRTELAASESRRAALEREGADLARAHAADARRIADLDRDAAVRDERAAMARDLHDVVASRLSAIAIHAEAALSAPAADGADPERDALVAVRTEALASLAEMRSMILVLRGTAPDAPVAQLAAGGLDRLDDLVATARGRGLDVRVRADPTPALPAVVDQAAYRIAHEALTNAAAHGPRGGRVDVRVTTTGTGVELEVLSALAAPGAAALAAPTGPGPAPGTPVALGTATGLVTMAERARSLGGSLSAGPGAGDGVWRVHAVLPLDGRGPR